MGNTCTRSHGGGPDGLQIGASRRCRNTEAEVLTDGHIRRASNCHQHLLNETPLASVQPAPPPPPCG